MSITDELRKVAAKTECANGRCEKLYRGDLEHIADRIDAEHKQQMAERRRSCVFYDAERNHCKVHDEVDIAELGLVRLPKDADGVPIHVGDVMAAKLAHGGSGRWVVDRMELTRAYDQDLWQIALDKDGACWVTPSTVRHHHAPTVEDVLREFALAVCKDDALTIRKDVVDEYAAKLRLAEGEDA